MQALISKRSTALIVAAAALASAFSAFAPSVTEAAAMVPVIVREVPRAGDTPERTVRALGGNVGRHIDIVDAFTATVPQSVIGSLESSPFVHSVTPDADIHLLGAATKGSAQEYDPKSDPGSMYRVTDVIKARNLWEEDVTGAGVDIALIDSGVSHVDGLTTPGKVINGPDLSFESQNESLRYLDTNGHGSHLAGIMAGRDDSVVAGREANDSKSFTGVAPDARIVSIKVADSEGATDVSQVLAAIDWVVQHRNDNGMNIRVLNLAFGTDGVQDYTLDPLTYAAEVAWRKGIVVVVAAGNRGYGSAKLNNPAYDPYLIAVGAADTNGTYVNSDDSIPDWSSRGDGTRNPDFVAPGKSIVSLRSPGSDADVNHPEGHVADRFQRGSGTSQAAAVVSGAAALIIDQRPGITPDEVKALLASTASPIPGSDARAQGAGLVNLKAANRSATPSALQTWPAALGTGSLELARGSAHLEADGVELVGEQDIFGTAWDGVEWSKTSWSETSWSGGVWNKTSWSGDTWTTDSWAKTSWSGITWTKTSWSKTSWSKTSWSKTSWSKTSWSGNVWSNIAWE